MRKLQWRVFFVIIAMTGIMASVQDGSAQVTTSQKVPPQILALVPEGAQVTGQSVTVSPVMAEIDLFAERKSGLRSQTMTQYQLRFYVFEANNYWNQILAPTYRQQIETDSSQQAQNWPGGENGMVSPAEVTQYPWGKGVTQRRRFFGEGAADFYSYRCAYFGLAGTTRFELKVDEIADRAEADKWAAKAAETAANLIRSSLNK
jgi:hypothetical protein